MAQLAIRGHATRGNEVIEILEMLGGINTYKINYTEKNLLYCLREGDNVIIATYPNTSITNIFTLEEFLEHFPYKVGESVSSKYLKNYKIEKAEWKSGNNRVIYKLQGMGWYSVGELEPYKEETMEEKGTLVQIDLTSELLIADEVEVILGDYEFVLKDGKTYFVKKKPKYPKTYEECCNVIGCDSKMVLGTMPVRYNTLVKLEKLLICRDAYWKIAGEQMGLGEPWKPDWTNNHYQKKWIINFYQGEINLTSGTNAHFVLAFPTEEMRDAFKENFDDDIKFCKEFL